MINEIELTNWKTHEHTLLNFQKGTNVVIGIMGSGKSSIMDAISFAFFGSFPSLEHRRVSLDDVITNWPVEKDSAEIRLTFTVDNSKYQVKRTIEREKGSSASLEKDGVYMQSQTERVNEEIERLLKLNYDTFSRAVYAEQNGLDYFLELRKGERKREMDEMLNLDKFATAEENTTSTVNSLRNTVEDEGKMLAQVDINEMRAQMEKLVEERSKTEGSIWRLNGEIDEKKKTANETKAALDSLKKDYTKMRLLSDEIKELSGKIGALNSEMKKIDGLRINEKKLQEELTINRKEESNENAEFEKCKEAERKLTKRVGELGAEIKSMETGMSERAKMMAELKGFDEKAEKRRIEDTNTLLKDIVGRIASGRSRREEASRLVKDLDRHLSECPLCGRALEEEMRKKLLDDKKDMIKKIDGEILNCEEEAKRKESAIKKASDLYNRLVSVKERVKDYEGIDEKIAAAKKELKGHKDKLDAFTADSDTRLKKLNELREQYNSLRTKADTINRKKAYEGSLEHACESLAEKEKAMKGINVDEKKIYDLNDAFTKESAILSDISAKMEGEKRHLESITPQIDEKIKQTANFEAMNERIEEKRKLINSLNRFKGALIDTEAMLRNSLVTSINGLMQNLWPQLYPYGDYSSIRLNAKKDDYLLEARRNSEKGDWAEVDAIASGGERSTACLVMRIALSMVIVPNLRWLILDEPTHNLDSAGISRLIEVLSNGLPNVVEQVFIITHDESLKQISSAKIYQFDRDKAASGPTLAEEI